jgi:hypothetical protein
VINEVRTLLFNRDGQGFVLGPGEEYVDPAYRAVPLSGPAAAVRALLYGAAPDRATALVRTFQYLQVLHASPLAEAVSRADPRVTYLPLDQAALVFGPPPVPGAVDLVAATQALQAAAATAALLDAAPGEPWQSWRNLWASNRPLPDRLAAVVLALAAATKAAREGA